MAPVDFTLEDVPVFVPDVADWNAAPCDFVDVNDLSNFIHIASFSILMINIHSCKKNFDQFSAYFCDFLAYFSCIIFTETWLTADRDNVFSIPGFYCHNLYRNGRTLGGGIKIYLRNCIQSKVLNDFTLINDLCELLTVELIFGVNKTLLSVVYHPPTSSVNKNYEFVDFLYMHVNNLLQFRVPLIFAGDTNVNLFNPYNHLYVDRFINNFFEFGLIPLVTIPTRINAENRITRFSLIDHIWVSPTIHCQQSLVIPVDITDHFPVISFLRLPFTGQSCIKLYKCRTLLERGKVIFRTLISNIIIDVVEGNFNLTFDGYVKKVFECYDASFPLIEHRIKSKRSAPWITPRLKQCISKKAKLYKLLLKGRITRANYNFYRNRLTALLRRAKKLYYAKSFLDVANDSGKTWSLVNDITERKNKQTINEIKVGDDILTGMDLVNYANNYFVTAVIALTRNLTSTLEYVFRTAPLAFSCFLSPTNPTEVKKIIKWLKNKGNKILDIHPTLLKENHDLFSHQLSDLYNLSVKEVEFPNRSKVGKVNPVHKVGPTDIIDNYRPISVLSVFSKIFEKLTLTRMENFAHRQKILTPCQFGFRHGRSTTHAIIEFMSHLIPAYHGKMFSVCFFLDLRKAFDLINHKLLLLKLDHYGYRGHCLKFLESYYRNRQQFVYVNGHSSDMLPITHGVPQGSILGPLCFNLFINDLPLAVDAHTVLFADDAAFVLTAHTLKELYSKILKLFVDIGLYLNNNKLVANSTKSKLMMFSSMTYLILYLLGNVLNGSVNLNI